MKGNNRIVIALLSCFCFLGCQKTISPKELTQFLKNPSNGLRKTKTIGVLQLELIYQPASLTILNEHHGQSMDSENFNKQLKELEEQESFLFRLKIDDGHNKSIANYNVRNESERQQRLYYLSYQMKKDIYLVMGKDTLPPMLYHFEGTFDLAPHRAFMVAFEKPKNNEALDRIFVLDSPMFGTGPIKLKIKHSDIENTPNVEFSKY